MALGECTSSALGGGRSILLSYGRILSLECLPRPRKSNTVGFLRRRTLYPAELQGHVQFIQCFQGFSAFPIARFWCLIFLTKLSGLACRLC